MVTFYFAACNFVVIVFFKKDKQDLAVEGFACEKL